MRVKTEVTIQHLLLEDFRKATQTIVDLHEGRRSYSDELHRTLNEQAFGDLKEVLRRAEDYFCDDPPQLFGKAIGKTQ